MAKIPSRVVAVKRLVPSTLTVASPSGMRCSESKTTPLIAARVERTASGAGAAESPAPLRPSSWCRSPPRTSLVVSALTGGLTGGLRCWAGSAEARVANRATNVAATMAAGRGGKRRGLVLTANQEGGRGNRQCLAQPGGRQHCVTAGAPRVPPRRPPGGRDAPCQTRSVFTNPDRISASLRPGRRRRRSRSRWPARRAGCA